MVGLSRALLSLTVSAPRPHLPEVHLEIDRDIGGKDLPHDTIEILCSRTEPSKRENQNQFSKPIGNLNLFIRK